MVAQAHPNVVEQRVELAHGLRRPEHLLIRRIPQLRLDVQLRAELYGFAIDRHADHNADFARPVYLILSRVEKNRECAFAHNTSLFCSCRAISVTIVLGKGTVNNWFTSRHFQDNRRRISDLCRKSLLKFVSRFSNGFSNATSSFRGFFVSFGCPTRERKNPAKP